ncbi:MAG: hypothetical protein IKT82_00385 [Bacteroidaceae bacterium]|nr:hypothetical protein [Bacteroidaceae bacterium]
MLHVIFNIIMGIILFFAILYLILTIVCLISSKDFRKWFWEESVKNAKETERKKKPKWRREETEYYKRTGKRHFLARDHRKD